MIPIVCGDPRHKPATSTRFVLPFAYALADKKPYEKGKLVFRCVKEDTHRTWRIRYLTDETSEVLFKRAMWFEVPNDLWMETKHSHPTYFPNGSVHEVTVSSPQIVLFEFPQSKTQTAEKAKPDLLQIGFLIIETYFSNNDKSGLGNLTQPNLDDLLSLNELIRYWHRPFDGHDAQDGNYFNLLRDWPVSLVYSEGPKVSDRTGHDLYFERWAPFLEIPIIHEDDEYCRQIVPMEWQKRARKGNCGERELTVNTWDVYADNRAFVWTCAIVEEGGAKLRQTFQLPEIPPQAVVQERQSAAWNYGHWIKLLNVDPPGFTPFTTHLSREFEREWTRDRTNKRWEECGTFYGFSYHSGAMLGPTMTDLPLWRHFSHMYFDQVLLILYIRVVLFRFSALLSLISKEARDAGRHRWEEWGEAFERLRWHFSLFTNLYHFPMLSNQQQGLEMYTLARKSMDVDDLFREVQQEIQGTNDYLMALVSNKLGKTSTRLSLLAAVGLPIALALSFMGISILPTDGQWLSTSLNWLIIPELGITNISYPWGLIVSVVLIFISVSLLFYGLVHQGVKVWKRIKGGGAR